MSSVALVTGGGRGIGRAVAQALLADGWAVAVTGRDPAALAAVEGALALPGDTTDRGAVTEAVARTSSELGVPDLVLLNAGRFATGGPLWRSDPDDWWRDTEVNLRGPMLVLHAVLPAMVARGSGRVVLMGSGFGVHPVPHASGYGVSKAAAHRLVETVAGELAGTGVVALTVSPGLVGTAMTDAFPAGFLAAHPEFVARPRRPAADLVALVRRVATGELDPLTGAFLHVDDDLDVKLAEITTAC